MKWNKLNTYDAGIVDEVLSTGGFNVAPPLEKLMNIGILLEGVIETSIARLFNVADWIEG